MAPTRVVHEASNRQQLVKNVTDRGGSDADGHTWLSPGTFEGLESHEDDDAALFEYIKTAAAVLQQWHSVHHDCIV